MAQRNTLLLVDDMASNRAYLRKLFEDGYDLLEAEGGIEAMRLIAEHHGTIAAVLLDLIMPVKDGFQVLAEMREQGYLSEIPVIVVTADGSQRSEARALELGALDLVAKPYDPYVIRRRVQNLVELNRSRRILTEQVGEMARMRQMTDDSIVNTLATITEFRSLESGQHILRIRKFAQILLDEVARSFPEYELDEKKIATISSAAVLHDIGKISIPDSVLNKPGKLTAEEFETMKAHTTAGCDILAGMTQVVDREYMRYAYNICRYHHERWDGRGYPDGLKGENIPICAQVVSIADVYDALTTKRVYKGAVAHEESVNMILNGDCGVFNPRLLECFKHVCESFAECARAYADGAVSPAEDIHIPLPPPKIITAEINTQQMSTIKYHTLLNYVGGVVVEVDVDSDTYHLVYDASEMFSALKRDGSFGKVILQLIRTAVHPEDQAYAGEAFAYLKKGFFEEGLRRYSQKFRLRADDSSRYFWTECTFLRLDVGDPNQHKAIVAWKSVSDAPAHRPRSVGAHEWGVHALLEMVGIVMRCRNDKWQTILNGGDRLAELLGYTREEFEQACHGRLMEIILPEDRDTVRSHANKQLSHAATAEVEYRLMGKGGRITWVRDRACVFSDENGVECIYHAVVDNTGVQETLDQLRSVRERHQLLVNQIDEITFEWDVVKDSAQFSANFKKKLGYDPATSGFAQRILDGVSAIHPDDLPFLQKLLRNFRTRQDYSNYLRMDFRLRKADGGYVWYQLRASVQQMENGKTECLIGTLADIDAAKRALAVPHDKAEQDLLTKLCTRQVAEQRIGEYLAGSQAGERSALLLIDLDHFNEINQRYGRMAGDAVLLQCAGLMHKLFREGDILARIGGDEFMVLVKNVTTQAELQTQCSQFIEAMTGEIRKGMPGSRVTCSIGIALTPGDGNTFDALFQRAEQALLLVKLRGYGAYAFYEPGKRLPTHAVASSRIESNDFPGLADQSLVFYAFNRLYQSGNVEETVQSILEIVGRQMNVSRVYIFENTADNRFCNNTFEWCNEGVKPEIGSLQNVSYETDVPGWATHYNAQGVFLCENIAELPPEYQAILRPQGIKSMLHCAIMDGDVFRGFVGLDECVTERTWTREQVDVLSMVAKLTSVFLLKKRMQDTNEQWVNNLISVIERSPDWIYAIDPDTCEILFSNSRVQRVMPAVKPGAVCYKAMLGRDTRCEECPAAGIRETERSSAEVENRLLGIRMQVDTTRINWNGRDAALLICGELPGQMK